MKLPPPGNRLCLFLLFLLSSTLHLPAPITEIQTPAPTPAATPTAKPTPTHVAPQQSTSSTSRQANATRKTPAIPAAVRFGGVWQGTLHGSNNDAIIVVINLEETSATIKGIRDIWGDRSVKITRNGNTLSLRFLAEKWTMVAAPDGKTASVSATFWPVGTSAGTLTRMP